MGYDASIGQSCPICNVHWSCPICNAIYIPFSCECKWVRCQRDTNETWLIWIWAQSLIWICAQQFYTYTIWLRVRMSQVSERYEWVKSQRDTSQTLIRIYEWVRLGEIRIRHHSFVSTNVSCLRKYECNLTHSYLRMSYVSERYEWDMTHSYLRMSHVSERYEWYMTHSISDGYEWVMSHMNMGTCCCNCCWESKKYKHEERYEWVMTHSYLSETWLIHRYEWVMSRWRRNTFWRCGWVMFHRGMKESCLAERRMSHVSYEYGQPLLQLLQEITLRQTTLWRCAWVMSQRGMNESCLIWIWTPIVAAVAGVMWRQSRLWRWTAVLCVCVCACVCVCVCVCAPCVCVWERE